VIFEAVGVTSLSAVSGLGLAQRQALSNLFAEGRFIDNSLPPNG
jgi:hypothetical protein